MNDQQLVDSILQGDDNAFKLMVEQHQQLVLQTCIGLVHDRHDAEDLAQEIFVEVFHSISKFRKDSKLSTWIYRIAVNKSLNFIRDNKRKKVIQSVEEIFHIGSHSDERPDHQMEDDQRKTNLYKAIDSLPERQKIAFTMSKIDDLSYQEIAEIMGLSLSSVESLIHRAKLNLQKKLYQCYKKGI